MTTGEQVRAARKARGMRQEDLAAAVRCSTSWIKQLEKLDELPDGRYTTAVEHLLGLGEHAGDRTDIDRVDPRVSRASTLTLATELARRLASEVDATHNQANVEAFELRGKTLRDDSAERPGDNGS